MKPYFLLTMMLLAISCSTDDDANANPPTTTSDYFPLALNNQWNYTTTAYNDQTSNINTTETVDGNDFFKYNNVLPTFAANGDALIRKVGNQYFTNATFGFNEIEVPIQNFMFLDSDANIGSTFSNFEETLDLESIPFQFQTISGLLTPSYTLKIRVEVVDKQDNSTINGVDYQNSLTLKWTYSIKSIINLRDNLGIFNIDHTLIEEQEAGTLQQFYVDNIGIVRTELDINLSEIEFNTLVSIAGVNFDITEYIQPFITAFSEGDVTNVSELSSHTLN